MIWTAPLHAFDLAPRSGAGSPGGEVTIPVVLRAAGTPVAAVVFEVEYDQSKLQFEPVPSGAAHTLAVGIAEYQAEKSEPLGETGRIGISIYDPAAPVADLPDGTAVPLRFRIQPNAAGFAYVRVAGSPAPDAANSQGVKVGEWNPTSQPTGVFITSARAEIIASPASIAFGTARRGERLTRDLLLRNPGDSTVSIQTVAIEPGSGPFSVEFSNSVTLSPRSMLFLRLGFESSAVGAYGAQLRIDQALPFAASIRVPLSGSVAEEGTFSYDRRMIVPYAVHDENAIGTSRTALTLLNPTEKVSATVITFLPSTGIGQSVEIRLDPGQARHFEDILGAMDQWNVVGAILLDSSSSDLIIRSELTVADASCTASQQIPIIEPAELHHVGRDLYLGPFNSPPASIVLSNFSDAAAPLRIELLGPGRTLLAEQNVVMDSRTVRVIRDIAPSVGTETKEMFIRIGAAGPEGLFYAVAVPEATGARLVLPR